MDLIEHLLAARREARALDLPDALKPADVAAGYAAQRALAERLGALPPAGFKIGATTARMRAYLGLDGPAAGFVQAAGLHASGVTLPYVAGLRPGAECEIGVRLGRDLPPGPCTREAAAAAVAEVFAAIELVENRYPELAGFGTPTLIADQVFHAAAVLGPAVRDWRDHDLAAVRGELLVDGETRGAGHGRDLLGHPLEAVRWLAASEASRVFGGLRAGQVIMLGSVTPPIWLDRPCVVTVRFRTLGEAVMRLVAAQAGNA